MATDAGREQNLRRFMLEHNLAVKEIQMLDVYILELTKMAFDTARKGGHTQQVIRILRRKSVAASVKDMYQRYHLYKWFKVQWLTNLIFRDSSSNRDVRQKISEVNAKLAQMVRSIHNQNEAVISERTATELSSLYGYHSRSS